MKGILKINMDETGLRIFFNPYQVSVFDCLITHPSANSLKVYNYVRNAGVDVSRASVINFLNKMVDWGILLYTTNTGKGGMHRVYYLPANLQNEHGITAWINAEIVKKMRDEGIGF